MVVKSNDSPIHSTESLKACPFCGGNNLTLDNLTQMDDFSVECGNCQLSQHAYHTRESAIRAWNTRATLPALEKLRDAIVEAIKAVQEPAAPGGSNYIAGYRDGALWKQEQLESIIDAQFASFMAQKKGE